MTNRLTMISNSKKFLQGEMLWRNTQIYIIFLKGGCHNNGSYSNFRKRQGQAI